MQTKTAIRRRLLHLAEKRLRDRNGAFERFRDALCNTTLGISAFGSFQASPATLQVRWEKGEVSARAKVDEQLLAIIDRWAAQQLSHELAATPASLQSATGEWCLPKPQRFPGYRRAVYEVLKAEHAAGRPLPSAREVLDALQNMKPWMNLNIHHVATDGIWFYDHKGEVASAGLDAVAETIRRLTECKPR